MKGNFLKRLLSITAAAACLAPALRIVTLSNEEAVTADAASEILTAFEITEDMKIGWNIGNSLDSTTETSNPGLSSETAWGNPKVTQELIDAVKAKGFNTIRIPTTWYQHLDENNNIDPEWLARVHEVVDYAYNRDMYVILNLHHEDWVNRADLGTAYDEMKGKLLTIWQQLADEFTDYDQHLIFECMNEPRAIDTDHEWYGPLQSECDTINQLNADFVELIRNDDSPYADTRLLMIPGYCASSDRTIISKVVVPDDDYVAVSIHAYSPYGFTMDPSVSDHSQFTDAYATELSSILDGVRATFIDEDIPVVIGEFGASNYGNTEARCEWAELYISTTKKYGIPCVLWDNAARNNVNTSERHDYINRSSYEWYEDSVQVVDTMMSVHADESIVWGSEGKGPEYIHDALDSGDVLSTTSQSIDASVANGNCTSNFSIDWSNLQGKDIAVQYTGDTPLACFMDSSWKGWTQVNPYDVDKDAGIAYYSYDDIAAAWNNSSTPAYLCFMTMGVTTVTKVSIIDAGVIDEGGNTGTTDPTEPTTEPTTDEDFVFETMVYDIELPEGSKEGSTILINLEGEAGASVGGSVGYGTNADDWVNIEWSTTISTDGTAEVVVDISEIPDDFTAAQIQIWWSNVAKVDYPCEMVNYTVVNEGTSDVKYGDTDLSGKVELNDAVKIMCWIADEANNPLTDAEKNAADVYQRGDGVNNMDALSIQKSLAQLISELPESYME